jgi:hypothetical protein
VIANTQEAKMKKFLIVIMIIVVTLGLSTAFYPKTVEVKVPVQKDVWNRAGSGFELTSVQTALPVPAPTSEPLVVAPSQAEAGGQHDIEALPTIDPADRKFFNPGYGAISGESKEVQVLPTIDPADRKFFNPGYGVIFGVSKGK